VFAPAEHLKHPPGMVRIGRLAQYLPITFRHRIAPQDQATIDSHGNVGRFLAGETGNELIGRFATALAAFGLIAWDDNFKLVTSIGQ
jgi:hypothetical protein